MDEEWAADPDFWESFEEHLFGDKWNKADQQIQDIIELTGVKNGKVLDMACGPGRHSLALARHKRFEITAVDQSEYYLEKAEELMHDNNLSEIEFKQADMRDFVREEEYDLILNLFTSFGYYPDDQNARILRNWYQSLNSGGKLVIQTLSKEALFDDFQRRYWEERNDHYFLQEREITSDWKWLEMKWIKIKESGERSSRNLRVRLYSAEKLEEMLTDVGFSSVKFYKNFSGDALDTDAKRLVAVAEK